MDPFKSPKKGMGPKKPGAPPGFGGHGFGMLPTPPTAYKPQAPPSGRKQQGLLQTINKLEQESEDRAFELIRLRTLVLKLEKEKEDAVTVCEEMKREFTELQQELSKTSTDLQVLKREHNELKCRQWLEGAQGLSTVRTALLAGSPSSRVPNPTEPATEAEDTTAMNSPAFVITSAPVARAATPERSAEQLLMAQSLGTIAERGEDDFGLGTTPGVAAAPHSTLVPNDGIINSCSADLSGVPARAAGAEVMGATRTSKASTSGAAEEPASTSGTVQQALGRSGSGRGTVRMPSPLPPLLSAGGHGTPPLSPGPNLVTTTGRTTLPSLQQQQMLQQEASVLAQQLQDFKDRVMYLQQELTEEKKKHDACMASKRQLEERLFDITASVGARQSASGSMSGAERSLTRSSTYNPRSPARGAEASGIGAPVGSSSMLREQRSSGLSAATEASLVQLQELMAKLQSEKDQLLASKQKELDALKQETESLKTQLGDAQRVIIEKLAKAPSPQDVKELKDQVVHFKKQSASRNKQLEEANAKVAAMTQQLELLQNAQKPQAGQGELETKLKDAEGRATTAEARLANADKQMADLQQQVEAAQAQASAAAAEAAEAHQRTKTPEQQLEHSAKRAAHLQGLAAAAAAAEAAAAEAAAAEPQLAASPHTAAGSDEHGKLAAKLAATEARAKATQQRLEEVEAKLAALEKDAPADAQPAAVTAAEARATAAEARLNEAEVVSSALQEQTARLAEAQSRAEAVEQRLAAAESKAASSDRDLSTMTASVEQLQQQVALLTSERDDAAAKAAESRARSAELESQIAGAEARATELQRQFEAAKKDATEASTQMAEELAEKEGALAQRAQELEARTAELASTQAARDDAAATAQRLDKEVMEARERSTALQAQVAQLETSTSDLEVAFAQAQADRDAAQAKASDLSARLDTATTKAGELQAKVDDMAASHAKQVAAMAQHDVALADLAARTRDLQAQLDTATAEKEGLAGDVARLQPELEAAKKLLGQREADLASAKHDLETTRADRDAKAEQLAACEAGAAKLTEQLAEAEPSLTAARNEASGAQSRADAQQKRAEVAEEHGAQLHKDLTDSHMQVVTLRSKLDFAESRLAQLTETLGIAEDEVTTLRADNAHTSAEVAQLTGKNERMQTLIKDMASQMEVLQGNLAKQTAVVARLEAALNTQGMAVAEIEDLHRSQSMQLKERAEDAERKLTSARVKLNEHNKNGNGPAPTHASTKSEMQALFKKLKSVAQVYKLTLASSLSKQMRTEGSNVTDLQLFQVIHGVLAALEASAPPAGGATALPQPDVGGQRGNSSSLNAGPLSPLPAAYDMRAALANGAYASSQVSTSTSPNGTGTLPLPIGRTSSYGSRPHSGSKYSRGGASSGSHNLDQASGRSGAVNANGHEGHGPPERSGRASEIAEGALRSSGGGSRARGVERPTETGSLAVQHSQGPSIADSVVEDIDDNEEDSYSGSSDTLPQLPPLPSARASAAGAGPASGTRDTIGNCSRPNSARLNDSRRGSEAGGALAGITSVPHLPPLMARSSQTAIVAE